MKRLALFIVFLLMAFPLWAATYYVRTDGHDAATGVNDTTNASTGAWLTLSKALTTATAGDTVLFHGGTYAQGTNPALAVTHGGTADDDSHRVIFKAYPGETPDITGTVTASGGAGKMLIALGTPYVTFDGLSFHVGGFNQDENFIFGVGYDGDSHHFVVKNCHLHMTSQASGSNIDLIVFFNSDNTNYNNYSLIYNNDLEGPDTGSGGAVLIYSAGTGNRGIKILNNNINGLAVAINCKHPNCDTSRASGAEWAYNYIYNISYAGIAGWLKWVNVHDNIIDTDRFAIKFTNGGTGCGCCDGALVNHNTIHGSYNIDSDAVGFSGGTVTNNVWAYCFGGSCQNNESYAANGTWSYNLRTPSYSTWPSGSNEISGNPTYIGGSHPSTVAGFALTTSSRGEYAHMGEGGSDGRDRGADVTLVGVSPSGSTPTAPTSVPTVGVGGFRTW